MNDELLKKLKVAGLSWHYTDGYTEPSLEELVEACGEKIRGFTKDGNNLMGGTKTWGAWAVITHSGGEYDTELTIWGYGRIPLVAVANLYLALNKKS